MVAASLTALVGLARTSGGLALLVRGGATDARIQAGAPVAAVGLGLVLVGVMLMVASIGLARRSRWGFMLAVAALVAFLIGGAVNGYLLYGRPGGSGTAINVVAAVLIAGCLLLGRGALRGGRRRSIR
jgi:hypothetical protein